MPSKAQEQKQDHIAKVVSHLKKRLNKDAAKDVEAFVTRYYDRVAPEDVLSYSVENLYGAALSLWKYAEHRDPGTPKIRVYNPNLEEHGWNSSHTVVEVVNDDMPFLVDSVTAALSELALTVHIIVHPLLGVRRDGKGNRTALIADVNGGDTPCESFMHIEINEQSDPQVLSGIQESLEKVLSDVRAAVDDWPKMMGKLDDTVKAISKGKLPLDKEEVDETIALLKWMGDNHFTFLGYREYDYEATKGQQELKIVDGSGLGILQDDKTRVMGGRHGPVTMSPEVRQFLGRSEALIVTKANVKSTVHRPVYLDYVGVKTFNAKGKVVGERRFIGLFTSAAYNRNPRDIPFLRRKVQQVIERADIGLTSHDGKALLNILEQYPRDELFQVSVEELTESSMGILELQERPRIRLFARRDEFERFVSCLVYVPRERYNTDLRKRFQRILREGYNGRDSAFYTLIGDSPLARLHFIVGTNPGDVQEPDVDQLELRLIDAARSWSDNLYDALIERWGEEGGNRVWHRFSEGFPTAYKEVFSAHNALHDIEKIDALDGPETVGLNLYRRIEDPNHAIRFKIYHPGDPVPLSDCLPMLEHMGLKVIEESPFSIGETSGKEYWIHDFLLHDPNGGELDLVAVKPKFEEAFEKVWFGGMEDDGFNQLVLRAGLDWREVVILRAYCKYLRQTGITFSQDYMEDTLACNPDIAHQIVVLFKLCFDPSGGSKRDARIDVTVESLKASLDDVTSLDEDRILRRFINLVQSTLRTNFFQPAADGDPKPYVSFKLDSQRIHELPLPRPYKEIWVYSPRVEGVHLRGGEVARGGIRWSDRREDFRTEVLGLMKAQMVKNSVIVPVGAKGGFVAKRLPVDGDRDAVMDEVVQCYQTLIRGMLDVTDNLVAGDVAPPHDVVRRDDDDPYLVVAADKGTATFSDIANALSLEYGFWLGDAFASGGSAGYDHKKMGITARGAWESVKRHFREMDRDIQTSEFTAIGVGDMSGDVFGNGMLQSRHTKLIAAFDHRHVFIDPDPDPEKSFSERERMFALPRSSWDDYDKKLISKGGGVFSRAVKAIKVTPEIKKLLNISESSLTPAELIKAILKVKVDLLWFGGIGTYVKHSDEKNADVGDRANDSLRIDAKDLKCLVVGEGANLGLTQRARIEFGLKGGRVNADAVDNSAGVDCSDHEVNIKILLGAIVDDGEMTGKQRDKLLADMTDEVADLVLVDNYLQTQALTIAERRTETHVETQIAFMRAVERAGRLDRVIEFLPDDDAIAERLGKGQGLSRPELSVLMAYAKNGLYADLLVSDLPDDAYLAADLVKYFPRPLRRRFTDVIHGHRLRREIIATIVANSLVNRAGLTFIHEISDKSEASVADITRSYVVAREVFRLRRLWTAIEDLDNKVDSDLQIEMISASNDLIRRATLWFLRNVPQPLDIQKTIDAYAGGIETLETNLETVLSDLEAESFAGRYALYSEQDVPEDIAKRIAGLEALESALDIVAAAVGGKRPVEDVGRVYFGVGDKLGLNWLRASAEHIVPENNWERQAVGAMVDDLFGQQRALTNAVLETSNGQAGADAIDSWSQNNGSSVDKINRLISEFRASGNVDVAKLALANGQIRGMIAH